MSFSQSPTLTLLPVHSLINTLYCFSAALVFVIFDKRGVIDYVSSVSTEVGVRTIAYWLITWLLKNDCIAS